MDQNKETKSKGSYLSFDTPHNCGELFHCRENGNIENARGILYYLEIIVVDDLTGQ